MVIRVSYTRANTVRVHVCTDMTVRASEMKSPSPSRHARLQRLDDELAGLMSKEAVPVGWTRSRFAEL